MSQHLTFLALGLGSGAVIALLALGVLVTYRASAVINFAHAALGMYVGFAYYELRQSGDLVLPVLGLPGRVPVVDRPTVFTSILVCTVLAAAVGAVVYLLIFRPLRQAPPLARVVASLGLMTYLIGIVDLRFEGAAATSLTIDGPLPSSLTTIAGVDAPADRWWLAVIAVAIGAGLWAMYRFTAFGLATRASAESEEGALLIGLAPTPIGLLNWMLAVVIAAVAVIAAAPLTGLDPAGTSLLIVPALGAALLGRFEAVWVTLFSGLAIGMVQSELFNVQADSDWLPNIGLQQGVPFLVVLIALVWRGSTLPGRGAAGTDRLPPAVAPTRTTAVTVGVVAAGVLGLLVLDSEWRLAIIISGIAAIIALSIIVLTGLVGQISLATFALAGTAAFAMVRSAEGLGLPFPFAPAVGILAALAVGTLAGLPAFRVRGLTLAVATLAASIAIEELLFKWSWFTGGASGSEVSEPSLFGGDLGIAAVGDAYPRPAFGVVVLLCVLGSMVVVVNLRRRSTGRQWLAVRSNERAAEAAGVSAVRAKLTANALASVLAGVAGVLIAYERQVISGSSFGALESLFAMAVAYLAGIATPVAALVAGALAAGGLLTVTLDTISEGSSKYQFTVNGLLLIVVAVRYPAGVLGAARSLTRRDRASTDGDAEPPEEAADSAVSTP
jgi:branched-subunit amino acid ABC-type transport system permease component